MGNRHSIKNEERSSSDEGSGLSYYQIQAIQRAWRHMSKGGQASCGRRIFQKYATSDNLPICQDKPFEWGILKHGEEIVCFLTYIIKNLGNLEAVEEKCQDVGRSHRKMKQYGMKEEHWDVFGEALSETISENYAWKKNRQLLKASNILANFVVDRIRVGFVEKEGNTIKLSVNYSIPENKSRDSSIKLYNTIGNGEICYKKNIHSPLETKYPINHNLIRAKSFDTNANPKRRILPGIPNFEARKIEQQDNLHNFQRRSSTTIVQYNRSTIFNRSRPCICNFTNIDYDLEGNITKCKEKL
uniref:GLOBIN domain-containing protein n=1 Tax=Strongyloides papillosus TaxID=174720 RepID=A0A0N5C2C6_STREA